jgi:hypothetical protein
MTEWAHSLCKDFQHLKEMGGVTGAIESKCTLDDIVGAELD